MIFVRAMRPVPRVHLSKSSVAFLLQSSTAYPISIWPAKLSFGDVQGGQPKISFKFCSRSSYSSECVLCCLPGSCPETLMMWNSSPAKALSDQNLTFGFGHPINLLYMCNPATRSLVGGRTTIGQSN